MSTKKAPEKASFAHRASVVAGIAVPGLGVPFLVWLLTRYHLTVRELLLFMVGTAVLYVITGFGVTAGYHRLFTHHSYQTKKWVEHSLAVAGTMALQGPLPNWVADHRKHHAHSDAEGDPHSPHGHGTGVLAVARGLWHAHTAWLLTNADAPPEKYAKELVDDPFISRLNRWYFPVVILGLVVIPGAIGFLIHGGLAGVWIGIAWLGLARAFALLQFTFCINSVCHVFGRRNFATSDQSRDVWWLRLFTLGESNHNGHHAFPMSFRHGLAGGLDPSAMLILALQRLGLAHGLTQYDEARIEAKRVPA